MPITFIILPASCEQFYRDNTFYYLSWCLSSYKNINNFTIEFLCITSIVIICTQPYSYEQIFKLS